ncbi:MULTISPECIES: DUF2179 domain-containing protein [unclassified Saccharicrinis]|uniref:DUF2179 domain-containing protein n=1 Tax=unclassified Saccharicrinis TaxID=2646859 RepID=UPI003D358DBB
MDAAFYDSFLFIYILVPLMIFFARILDVSMDTIRIIFVSRGNKVVAPILGFFEILIWLIAITRIFENLDNWTCYVAYAAGFATGNYVGLRIEERMAIGIQMIRIVTSRDASTLIETLRGGGFGVTSIDAKGKDGAVHVIYSIVSRNKIKQVIGLIQKFNPRAFYSIEDVRTVNANSYAFGQRTPNGIAPRWMRKSR